MSTTILHKADSRGHADHGWLDSHHTFSFAGYYNPERVQFGTLRVLNDDRVDGGRGFGAHPHDNMEIISIPLEGGLVHEDNLGHKEVTSAGEIQVMSTGKGVFHSEYNASKDQPVKFLQIWVFPNRLNVIPRYDQVKIDPAKGVNQLQQLIAPKGEGKEGEGTWIYQEAWFSSGRFDEGKKDTYTIRKQGNGAYVFVIKGQFQVDGQTLNEKDGLGISDTDAFTFQSLEAGSQILIMDIPMQNKLQ